MKDLHSVIVHEDAVRPYVRMGNMRAEAVMEEIRDAKKSGMYCVICGDKMPFLLPDNLPKLESGVRVLVLGAYKELCCLLQLRALREAGYEAYFNERGVLGLEDIGFV